MSASRLFLAVTAACLATALACPGVGLAGDEEVVTANARAAKAPPKADETAAKPASEAKPATREQFIARLSSTPIAARSADSQTTPAPLFGYESNGRTIHGTASVSVGTGGYSSFHVSSLIPVGESGTLGISVSQTDYGNNSPYMFGYDEAYGYDYDQLLVHGYGYGYGRGYGYGASPWHQRGGRSQSVGLTLDMSGDRRQSSTPEGCAPGFRDGDRYVEPVWVTRARGDRSCTSAEQP